MNATVLLAPGASREQWLAARRFGLGGSDIAPIFGAGKYGRTALSVWLDKTATEPVDDTAGEAAEWGNRLEPALRDKFAAEHPELRVDPSPGLVQHPEHAFALATPDGLTYGELTEGIWEGKNVNERIGHQWDDDTVPEAYMFQTHWYLAVTGARRAHVSALIGGQRYVERLIEADDDFSDLLLSKAGAWWQRHVVDGEMPEPDPARDGELLGRLWTSLDVDPHDISDLADVVDDLRMIRAQIKVLEETEERLVAQIKTAMAEHTDGYVGDTLAVTWRASKPRTRFDAKALLADDPETHARYVRIGDPVRSFLLKESKS